jgi:hypothetical protein
VPILGAAGDPRDEALEVADQRGGAERCRIVATRRAACSGLTPMLGSFRSISSSIVSDHSTSKSPASASHSSVLVNLIGMSVHASNSAVRPPSAWASLTGC